jgi:competence ComEA-like helix-hairpin-helix protein
MTCYLLLGAVFVYTMVSRYLRPLYLAEPIGVVPAPTAGAGPGPTTAAAFTPADPRVDPNTATWMELDRLPGIGEVTAKNIVQYREKRRAETGEPAFRSADDLRRVKGIGPKTLEQIRSGLRFPEASDEPQPSGAPRP